MEPFFDDPEKAKRLRSCFAPMFPANFVVQGQPEGLFQEVCNNPLEWVLKPQREGGGYNVWGDDIVKMLKKGDLLRSLGKVMSRNELDSMILMKRIFPKANDAFHVRESVCCKRSSLNEIGFYSALLFDTRENKLIRTEDVGVLVRTKTAESFEGGVSAGFAVMNSPILASLWSVC